jgi:hypothetical protein
LHTQGEHARWLVEEKNAGYAFVVKRNQPRLYRQVKALPWAKIPALDATRDRGHGRYDIRELQAVTCLGALALDFPYAVQALRIRRRRYNAATDRWSTVTVYAITNLTAAQANPNELTNCYADTGPSKFFTIFATPPTARTPAGYEPARHPECWPPCATPRSAFSAWTASPRSHRPYAETAEIRTDPYNSSDSPKTVISRPCEGPAPDVHQPEPCPNCHRAPGVAAKRFRAAVTSVLSPEAAAELSKAYGPRSRTVHAAQAFGHEQTFGLSSMSLFLPADGLAFAFGTVSIAR